MSTFGREEIDGAFEAFTAAMRGELERNAHKPDWKDDGTVDVLEDLMYHCAKLAAAVTFQDGRAIREYAADVANMAMILGDVTGALEMPQAEEPVLIGNVVFDVAAPPERGDGKSDEAGALVTDLGDAGREFLVRVKGIVQNVRSAAWVEGTAGKVGPS